MRNLDQEDINDIKIVAEEIQQIAAKFDYHNEKVATLCYDVDMAMRVILEIINGPSGTVERMIEACKKPVIDYNTGEELN